MVWFGDVTATWARLGRFNERGEVQVLAAHNSVIALYSVLVLVFGWIGFDGGNVSLKDLLLDSIIFNTISSAVFGASCGMTIGVWLDKGIFNLGRVATGMLGGLVACSAGVHLMNDFDAVVVGLLGGGVATYGAHVLLHRLQIDDPVDAIATHGVSGVLGTLALAFVAPESFLFIGSRIDQRFNQMLGVATVFMTPHPRTRSLWRVEVCHATVLMENSKVTVAP